MKKKIITNVGSSVLTQVIQIVSNVILPPLIILTYGSEINGLTASVKQIIGYVSIIGLGISAVSTQALYKPFLEKNYESINAILNATNKMFQKAGLIYTGILIIVSIVFPYTISSNLSNLSISLIVLAIGLSGISEFFVVGKYRSLLYADQKVYIYNIIQAIGLLASFIIGLIFIKLGASIILVQLGLSTIYIIRVFFIRIYVNSKYKYLDKNISSNNNALSKKNDALVHQLSGLAVGSTQVLFLSFFIGLNEASIYAIYNIVFSGFYSILSLSISAISPFLGRTYASGNIENINKEFKVYEMGLSIAVTFIYGMTLCLISPFILLYTQNADIVYENQILSILFVLLGFFNTIRLPGQTLINVAGHFKETRYAAIIESALCIILQLLLIPLFGIYGAVIGTLISSVWRTFDIIQYTKKILKRNRNDLIISSILSLIFIFVIYFMGINIFEKRINTYLDWAKTALILGILIFAVLSPVILFYYKKVVKSSYKAIGNIT